MSRLRTAPTSVSSELSLLFNTVENIRLILYRPFSYLADISRLPLKSEYPTSTISNIHLIWSGSYYKSLSTRYVIQKRKENIDLPSHMTKTNYFNRHPDKMETYSLFSVWYILLLCLGSCLIPWCTILPLSPPEYWDFEEVPPLPHSTSPPQVRRKTTGEGGRGRSYPSFILLNLYIWVA